MLKIRNITKGFPHMGRPALHNINLDLHKGDFCVILGHNGSGKSTLLRILSGDYTPDTGAIFLNDENITHHTRSKFIASVGQDITQTTVSELSLFENIVLSNMRARKARFSFYTHEKKDIQQKIHSLNIGLESALDKKMGELSGGQRQMIATMMAFSSNPEIVLLDEHTSALDIQMEQKVMNYVAHEVKQQNLITLMITHKLEHALNYGNRLLILKEGAIVAHFTSAEKQELSLATLHSYLIEKENNK